jgi:hypothetical protein
MKEHTVLFLRASPKLNFSSHVTEGAALPSGELLF